jgi:dienelactone hydrolase
MATRIFRSMFKALLGLALFASVGAVAETKLDHEAITIWSQGARLQGDIFKPAGLAADAKIPGILLVHGWGGVKAHMNRAYAPQFAELGFLVLSFDMRSWGESDGFLLADQALPLSAETKAVSIEGQHVRVIVDPLEMLEDARAALAYLVGESQVQADNIGIWGTSMGGGLALVTGANDSRVKAFVSQIGAVNNLANWAMIPPEMALGWETQRARGEIAPYPGSESSTPGLKGYPDMIGMMRYDPAAYWEKLTIPTLVIDAENEELFDRKTNGLALHESLKGRVDTEYLTLPGKHYAIYRDDGYHAALKAAQDWFVKYLKDSPQ